MRYFLKYEKGILIGYIESNFKPKDPTVIEVEPIVFKEKLNELGVEYELSEDKIERLEKENADLLLDIVTKDIRIEQTEEDLANILLTIGGIQNGLV